MSHMKQHKYNYDPYIRKIKQLSSNEKDFLFYICWHKKYKINYSPKTSSAVGKKHLNLYLHLFSYGIKLPLFNCCNMCNMIIKALVLLLPLTSLSINQLNELRHINFVFKE